MLDRISLSLVLVATCVALGACGSSSNSSSSSGGSGSGGARLSAQQYKQRLRTLAQREDRAHAAVDKGLHARSVAQIRKVIGNYAADQQAVAAEVSSLKPPRNAEAANTQLARGFRDTATELRAVLAKLSGVRTPRQALAVLMKLGNAKGGQEVDSALRQLKKLRYTKGS